MWSKNIGTRAIMAFVSVIAIAVLLVIVNIFYILTFSANGLFRSYETAVYSSFAKFQLVSVLFLIILLFSAFVYLNKNFVKPYLKLKENVNDVKNGLKENNLKIKDADEDIREISHDINEMLSKIEQNAKIAKENTAELNNKNWELQEAYTELEASYGQLQAMIEQLNGAEQKYHSLVRNMPDLVFIIESDGVVSFVNHICLEMLGFEKSYIIGKNFKNFIKEKDKTFFVQQIISVLGGNNFLNMDLIFLKNDGTEIITETKFTNYVSDGINIGLQAIVRDVTGKRVMEEELVWRNKELEILNDVNRTMTSTLDVDDVLQMNVDELTQKLKYPACVLGVVGDDGASVHIKAFSGEYYKDVEYINDFEAKGKGNEILKRVIGNNEIVTTSYIPKNMIIPKVGSDKAEKEKINELTILPMSARNKKIGILFVGAYTSINKKDVDLLSSIASCAAVAIDNALLYENSRKYFIKTIDALIAAVEAKDKYTEGHSQRVSSYSVNIAKRMGLEKEHVDDIRIAGILHDIGKIGISDSILSKASRLTTDEFKVIKQHPTISNKILFPIGFSHRTLKAIALHHERVDGKGYPYGLDGENIGIEAQIIAVADAYDAMTSDRSYRSAMGREEAVEELLTNKGSQFEPAVVDALVGMIEERHSALRRSS